MEGISLEELQLAARNHGMPLEALRWPITPVGLHYLLVHYDVPLVDAATWRLTVAGERELELSLDEVRSRPAVEHAVTLEQVAHTALLTLMLDPGVAALADAVRDKHFERKHGPGAYYGQR